MFNALRKLFSKEPPTAQRPPPTDSSTDCVAHRMVVTIEAWVQGDIYWLRFFPDDVDWVCERLGRMAADERLSMTWPASRILATRARGVARFHPHSSKVFWPIHTPAVIGVITRK